MNRRKRVLLVGRHFWPHGSLDSAAYLIQLSAGLERRGIQTEVLTPKFASFWSEEFAYQNVIVHRPVNAPKGDWSVSRYIRHLTNWLRENAKSFDVLMVDRGREELIAVADAARSLGCRTTARIQGWGNDSDVRWWNQTRLGRRCAAHAKTIDMLIAANADCHRQLLQQGFVDSRIHRDVPAVRGGVLRNPQQQKLIRSALAAINSDLQCDDNPVLLCVGEMNRSGGMRLLADSAANLVTRYPDLKIWFVGDGPDRGQLHDLLRGEGLRGAYAMPGSFAELNDVMLAADFYIQLGAKGTNALLPKAIAAELPLIVEDNEPNRDFLNRSLNSDNVDFNGTTKVQWFDRETPKTLRQAVRRAVDDTEGSQKNASQLRRGMLRSAPLDQTIEQYVQLFDELARRINPTRKDSLGVIS